VAEAVRPEKTPYGTLVQEAPGEIPGHVVGVATGDPSANAVPHRAVVAFPGLQAPLEGLLEGPEVVVGGLLQKTGYHRVKCIYARLIFAIGSQIAGVPEVISYEGNLVQAALFAPVTHLFQDRVWMIASQNGQKVGEGVVAYLKL